VFEGHLLTFCATSARRSCRECCGRLVKGRSALCRRWWRLHRCRNSSTISMPSWPSAWIPAPCCRHWVSVNLVAGQMLDRKCWAWMPTICRRTKSPILIIDPTRLMSSIGHFELGFPLIRLLICSSDRNPHPPCCLWFYFPIMHAKNFANAFELSLPILYCHHQYVVYIYICMSMNTYALTSAV